MPTQHIAFALFKGVNQHMNRCTWNMECCMPPTWDYVKCPQFLWRVHFSIDVGPVCCMGDPKSASFPAKVSKDPAKARSSIHSRQVSIHPMRVSIHPRQVSISVTVKDHSHQNRLAIQLLQLLVSTLLKLLVHHNQTLCGQNDIFLWCTMLSEQRWYIQTVNTRRPFMYTWWKSKIGGSEIPV